MLASRGMEVVGPAGEGEPTTEDSGVLFDEAVGRRTERAFSGASTLWIPALLGIVTFFDSWDSLAIALVAPSLKHAWSLALPQVGFLMSTGYAGQFAGALMFGALASRFGRVRILVASAALMSVFAIACALSHDYLTLSGLRFIQGLGIGGALPVSITYLNEIAPSRSRGRYIAVFQFVTTAGFIAASFASIYIVPTFGWRWMFGLGAIPLVVLPVIMAWVPESPRWLVRRGRVADACRVLDRFDRNRSASEPDLTACLAGLQRPVSREPRASLAELFKGPFLKRTVSSWAIWFLSAFVSFGITAWLPSIYVSVFHLSIREALSNSAVPNILALAIPLLVAVLIDRIGRRRLAMSGLGMAAITFAWMSMLHKPSVLELMVLTTIAQNAVTIGLVVLWPYTGELYSTRLRSLGVGAASSLARVASMLTPLVVGGVLGLTGSVTTVFGLFAACSLVVVVIWAAFCEETKERTLESISAD